MSDSASINQSASETQETLVELRINGPLSKTSVSKLSDKAEEKIQRIIERYPHRKSAVMPALYIAQEELGWCSGPAIAWVADRMGLTGAHVQEVATFYTMYYKKEVGKYHIQVCRTLSCMLCGSKGLVSYIKERCGFKSESGSHGQMLISENGFWSLEEVECLGSCGTAPMIQINDLFFENLTQDKLASLLSRIEREEPNLRYSTLRDSLGKGMPDLARSEVW